MNFDVPVNREVGIPGGGGFGRARDLALFYQALLHNLMRRATFAIR